MGPGTEERLRGILQAAFATTNEEVDRQDQEEWSHRRAARVGERTASSFVGSNDP